MVRNENKANSIKKNPFDRALPFQKTAVKPTPAIAQRIPQGFIALGAYIMKFCTASDKESSDTYWDP
jgi:hypothetical protein